MKKFLCSACALVILCANCGPPSRRDPLPAVNHLYSHSADYSDQFVYLSKTVALFKHTKTDAPENLSEVSYSFVKAHFAGVPDHVWASGDVIDGWLATSIQKVMPLENGVKVLLDTGQDLPSNPRYWVVDLKTGQSTSGSDVAAALAAAGVANGAEPKWCVVGLFFDMSRDVATSTIKRVSH